MEIRDNFNLFNLFLDKKVKIFVDQKFFYLRVPTIREYCLNDTINAIFHIWILPEEERAKFVPVKCEESLDLVINILFNFGMYKEYTEITSKFKQVLEFFIPNIKLDYKSKQLIVDDINITNEVWDYILYVLKLSCGEKVEKPRIFSSEAERQFYLAQKKMDEKIKKLKTQKPGDGEGLLKAFLSIQYKFNLSFEYLAEQTMAQIQWLQQYAAGAVSYEVNAQAFAAGNMKKGKKLDFFIK